MRVLLIAGTWNWRTPWWRQGSAFARMLVARGHTLAAAGSGSRAEEGWRWTTALEGLIGDNRHWELAGDHLRLWLQAEASQGRRVEGILAHSHGGSVAALALAAGAETDVLVTMGTPVRPELLGVYAAARDHVRRHVHLYSPDDRWQAWGTHPLRALWRLLRGVQRTMPRATNLSAPGLGHTDLLNPTQWALRGWDLALRGTR